MTVAKISAIGKVLRGVSWDKLDATDVSRPGYLPILRAGNIGNGLNTNDDLVWVPASNVSAEQSIRAGDIAICMSSGSPAIVGKTATALVDWPGSVGAFCALIRANSDQCLPEYLGFFLKSSRFRQWTSEAQGANIKNIRKSALEDFEIWLPSLPEQRRIVDLLSRAEGIFRLRREAEKKVAELIPALFLDMFGDPATNPKGWSVALLPDVLSQSFKNGLYLPKESYSADGVEMVHMSDAFYGEVKRGGLRRVLANKKQVEDYSLTKADLLVARRSLTFDGAAKLCGIPDSGDPLLFESSFIRLTPDLAKVRTEFLLYYLNNASTRQAHVLGRISGITISGINQAAMNQIPVLMPALPLQDSFVARVAEVRSIQSQQSTATDKAQAAFDALLANAFKAE